MTRREGCSWARGLMPLGLVLLLMAVHPRDSRSEWLPNGNPITHPGQLPTVRLAPDASGGLYVSWDTGYTQPLKLARFLADGRMAEGWPSGSSTGLSLFPYPWWGYPQSAIEDGHGGVFALAEAVDCAHSCGGDYHVLLATRIQPDAARAPEWPVEGVQLGIGGNNKSRPQIASDDDGQGGLLAAWSVAPLAGTHSSPREVRAQRVNASGELLWGSGGLVVQPVTPAYELGVTVVGDGRGGAFVFWLDAMATRIRGQHLSADGRAQWSDSGAVVVRAGSVIVSYRAIAEGPGGALLAWIDRSSGGGTLHVTRARGDRVGAFQTETVARWLPADAELSVAGDRQGGTLLAWSEALGDTDRVILAQHFDHGGQPPWGRRGVVVSSARSRKHALKIVSDGAGGAYLAWGDSRAEAEVYAMHLDRRGGVTGRWRRNGSPLCQPMQGLLAVELVADGNRAAFVAWTDERQYPGWLYADEITSLTRLTPAGPAASLPASETISGPRRAEATGVASPAVELAVTAVEPNPSSGAQVVRFSLPNESPAVLELLDVTGRRVWSQEVGSMGPGEHSIRIGGNVRVPSGVYFVRLAQGERVSTARAVVLR
jgi:hypothetical protein